MDLFLSVLWKIVKHVHTWHSTSHLHLGPPRIWSLNSSIVFTKLFQMKFLDHQYSGPTPEAYVSNKNSGIYYISWLYRLYIYKYIYNSIYNDIYIYAYVHYFRKGFIPPHILKATQLWIFRHLKKWLTPWKKWNLASRSRLSRANCSMRSFSARSSASIFSWLAFLGDVQKEGIWNNPTKVICPLVYRMF